MTGSRVPRVVMVAFVVVSLTVLLMVAGCGAGSNRSSTEGTTASDQPTVTLGGYTFASNSNVLTHPDFTAKSTSPMWTGKGYGSQSGSQITSTPSDGGLVAGVKTLKFTVAFAPSSVKAFWYAQDTLGNIHELKYKNGSKPAVGRGVAAGQPAWFVLRRAADLTKGAKWYDYENGVKVQELTVMSVSATWRGTSGLLWLREVFDANGDGVFNPNWSGPDTRTDSYYNPATHAATGIQVAATGGYAK